MADHTDPWSDQPPGRDHGAAAGPTPAQAAVGGPGPTVGSYFEAFVSAPRWQDLAAWPPDVFALTNLVLDHTEAYRFAVAPPPGTHWPPCSDWEQRVARSAAAWRGVAGAGAGAIPDEVRREWDRLLKHLHVPLAVIRHGGEPTVWANLLTLHAMADEACQRLAAPSVNWQHGRFERRAWAMLERKGTLSRIDPARVRITPKTQFASRGITIRSFSRYLALNYEPIDVRWRRIFPDRVREGGLRDYSIVLVPWPAQVTAESFRPVSGPLDNMDRDAFGFFAFEPTPRPDLGRLAGLLEEALRRVPRVDAVVFPEAALPADMVGPIEDLLGGFDIVSVIAGVRGSPGLNGLGQNFAQVAIRSPSRWLRFVQPKHHRWSLDASQIRQYGLSRVLDPRKTWWEAIELPPRTLELIDLGDGVTSAPLVCEDLARMDEVADLIRRIGPTLVVALLLDGPQLPQRWPCRYASVLADEPGSAVLTLTSIGMALRSRPRGMQRSRVVAMWNDPAAGLHQIPLGRGAGGILLRAVTTPKTVWTADGRRHERSSPTITLTDIDQLKVRGA